MTKILIVKLSSLGDVIHTIPFLKSLKESFPDSNIHWLISRSFKNIIEEIELIDKIHIFERERWRGIKNCIRYSKEIYNLFHTIEQEHYDLVIDFQGLFRSGFATYCSHAPRRIGFKNAREFAYFAYNEKVNIPENIQHAIDKNALLVEQAIHQKTKIDFPTIFNAEIQQKTKQWIQKDKINIALIPGARWDSKKWSVENFAKLTEKFLKYSQIHFLILGGKSEQNLECYFKNANTTSLLGKTTMLELASILQQVSLVVCNDSGPMHLSVAVQTPVLALFGPTDPNKTGPYGSQHKVLQASMPCSPCRNRKCHKQNWCMNQIAVEQVENGIKEILNNQKFTIINE